MTRKRTTHLDEDAFEQALAVLERARPSPAQDRLFRLLNVAVWSAVTLTAVYLAMRLPAVSRGDMAVWVARGIALVYVCIVPLFVANWRLVVKLARAARARRALASSFKRRLADRFRMRRSKRRIVNLATLILSVFGALLAAAAMLGLLLELLAGASFNAPRATLYAVLVVFGLSCMFLHFMTRGRERLQVIAELRGSLLASRNPADDHSLSPEEYDEITRIERGQISTDRRRSVRTASVRSMQQAYASKEHRTVRSAKLALPPETLVKVQACIDRLTREPDTVAASMRDGIGYLRVADTPLELGFTVDATLREIRLMSLGPAPAEAHAQPTHTVQDDARR